jgi:hypothetical protein
MGRIFRRRKWQETGEDCIMRSFTDYYSGDHIEDEMGGTCSRDGRGEKYVTYFGWKT